MNVKVGQSKHVKRRQVGFTLIEVLVAVSIFAIAGGAVMKTVYEHLRSLTTLEQITFATWVANNQLTRSTLESQVKWPLEKETNGQAEMAGQKWFWKREAVKTADAALYQVTVSVYLEEEMQYSVTSVTSFLAKVEP